MQRRRMLVKASDALMNHKPFFDLFVEEGFVRGLVTEASNC